MVNMMIKEVRKVCNVIKDLESFCICTHFDHDGIAARAITDAYLRKKNTAPAFVNSYELGKVRGVEGVILYDFLVSKYESQIKKLLEKEIYVMNFDHHDLLKIDSPYYFDLNPHNFRKEFISSSGVAWLVVKTLDEDFCLPRSWICGVGSARDYCIEDSYEIFKNIKQYNPELLKGLSFSKIVVSRITQLATEIDYSIFYTKDGPKIYKEVLNSVLENDHNALLKRISSYCSPVKKEFERIRLDFSKSAERYSNLPLVAYEVPKDSEFLDRHCIAELADQEQKDKLYVGMDNSGLFLVSFNKNLDAAKIASIYGGGGPHKRIGSIRTSNPNEIKENIKSHFYMEKFLG